MASLGARRVVAAALLGLMGVAGGSCVDLFELEGYSGATSGLCGLLVQCYGEDYFPSCGTEADQRLGEAAPELRAQWLTLFADSHCLENCVNARSCLDAPPLCGGTASACGQDEQCCGFTANSADCGAGGSCCARAGQPCSSDATCCSGGCSDGFCGGVECKLGGEPCDNDFKCCSRICSGGLCNDDACYPDGAECGDHTHCCSQYCDEETLRCGVSACAPDGVPCVEDKDCCFGVCAYQPYEMVQVCAPGHCIVDNFTCTFNEECCSNHCDVAFGLCGVEKPCADVGGECFDGSDCCSGHCTFESGEFGACGCAPQGYPCSSNEQCCNSQCLDFTCAISDCSPGGDPCSDAIQCCSGKCRGEACCEVAVCTHNECQTGAPLDPSCNGCLACDGPGLTCIEQVCNQNGLEYCCCTVWDDACKQAAVDTCGIDCPAVGMGVPPENGFGD